MFIIHYLNNGTESKKEYPSVSDFVGAQYREVPDLQDYFQVVSATVDGKEIELQDKTIGGLFAYLTKKWGKYDRKRTLRKRL